MGTHCAFNYSLRLCSPATVARVLFALGWTAFACTRLTTHAHPVSTNPCILRRDAGRRSNFLNVSSRDGDGLRYIWSKGFGLVADRSAGAYRVLRRPPWNSWESSVELGDPPSVAVGRWVSALGTFHRIVTFGSCVCSPLLYLPRLFTSRIYGRLTADTISDGDVVWIGIYDLPRFVSRILPSVICHCDVCPLGLWIGFFLCPCLRASLPRACVCRGA